MKKLEEHIIKALVKSNGFDTAPVKTVREGEWIEVILGIGKDHSARLTMTLEAYYELMEITS